MPTHTQAPQHTRPRRSRAERRIRSALFALGFSTVISAIAATMLVIIGHPSLFQIFFSFLSAALMTILFYGDLKDCKEGTRGNRLLIALNVLIVLLSCAVIYSATLLFLLPLEHPALFGVFMTTIHTGLVLCMTWFARNKLENALERNPPQANRAGRVRHAEEKNHHHHHHNHCPLHTHSQELRQRRGGRRRHNRNAGITEIELQEVNHVEDKSERSEEPDSLLLPEEKAANVLVLDAPIPMPPLVAVKQLTAQYEGGRGIPTLVTDDESSNEDEGEEAALLSASSDHQPQRKNTSRFNYGRDKTEKVVISAKAGIHSFNR